MALVVTPPVAPMLARLTRELPHGDFVYEPKWDGFRCLAFRDGEDVDLRSRNQRPLARYFPEIVEALRGLETVAVALDGELVVPGPEGLDFEALLARLHPAASRVERLREETPAAFVAFDVLAVGEEDLRDVPFAERRRRLEEIVGAAPPPLFVTPTTDAVDEARRWLERFQGAGIDGVVAKDAGSRYRAGAREMHKVKHEQTADCVVAGFRLLADRPLPSSLLLGLYDDEDELRHVGVASSFPEETRRALVPRLEPHVVPLAGHPWEHGFLLAGGATGRLRGAAGRWSPDDHVLDWIPVAPLLVCEVSYEQVDAGRLRHPARFRRWRPDRDPLSCRLEQLEPRTPDLATLLPLR